VPQTVTPLMVATIGSQIGFLLVCNAILLLVGCFMELLAAMLILIPIMVPAAIGFGVDPVHFGVMMILNLVLGTIHPPIGAVLFVTSRIVQISFEKMSRAILPWLIPLLVVLAAVSLWSPLTPWLPGMVFGK
jgi:TRAP-type C4-dicarboxylate transport system permease large subunit